MKYPIPKEEYITSGTVACQGCGCVLALRYVLKALGPDTAMCVPACCWSVIDGPFPYSATKVPLFHTAFETAASAASGLRNGFAVRGNDHTTVLAWAGDGGTADIGIQALSGAVERDEDIIYICYDNEAYMNTGIQRSGSTPWGAWTTTTPVRHFKKEEKKDIVEIMAAHGIRYTATAAISHPKDLLAKVEKAKGIRGAKYLQIFASCIPGWKMKSEYSIKAVRLGVQTGLVPLYEIEGGVYKINYKPKQFKPIEDYLKLQGRFRHLTPEQIKHIEKMRDLRWKKLEAKVKMTEALAEEMAELS
ncbi:MAG: pyruvate synthase subunit beta [Candidatus Coatesbacteria bacterium]|nr:pyruvate synthase subunit beta [Candidatus Coatesbacteria bacterium]